MRGFIAPPRPLFFVKGQGVEEGGQEEEGGKAQPVGEVPPRTVEKAKRPEMELARPMGGLRSSGGARSRPIRAPGAPSLAAKPERTMLGFKRVSPSQTGQAFTTASQ
jgi:hypothetical protein